MKRSIWLAIYKFEFKHSLKGMLIWSFAISLMSVLMFALYEPISEKTAELTEVMEMFPPEVFEAFGSKPENILTVEGFYNSKFISLFVLMNAIYAGILLNKSIRNEFEDGSMAILLTKKISKIKIFYAKVLAKTSLILISNIINLGVALLSIILFTSIKEIPYQYFITAYLAVFIVQMLFGYWGLFISLINQKFENLGLIGLTLGLFIIDSIARIDGVPEFIRYLTPFYYLDLVGIAETSSLAISNYLILIIITLLGLFLAKLAFHKKEI
jgi:ABC-2 type transport system permease protein